MRRYVSPLEPSFPNDQFIDFSSTFFVKLTNLQYSFCFVVFCAYVCLVFGRFFCNIPVFPPKIFVDLFYAGTYIELKGL